MPNHVNGVKIPRGSIARTRSVEPSPSLTRARGPFGCVAHPLRMPVTSSSAFAQDTSAQNGSYALAEISETRIESSSIPTAT
jgi:hypothetical protein